MIHQSPFKTVAHSFLKAIIGIGTELLYIFVIIAASFLVCLFWWGIFR
jgi:hypothetical protein